MARPRKIPVRELFGKMIPRIRLEEIATETGAVKRRRKVDIFDLFWTLVMGFAPGKHRTMASLRRCYEVTSGEQIVPSAFYDRFSKAFTGFIKQVILEILEKFSNQTLALRGCLESFKELLITDSTVVRLHDLLENEMPGYKSKKIKAAAKLHMIMTAKGAGMKSIKITPGKTHDSRVLKVGKWVRDNLFLFDLGYFNYSLFHRIGQHGGYFVSRLKSSANPVIAEVHSIHRGNAIDLEGQRVLDVLPRLRRETLDAEVVVSIKKRKYAGSRRSLEVHYRLVGRLDPTSGEYHMYLTNIPVDRLPPDDIAMAYAARWWIEMMFKSMKQYFRLEQIPSKKVQIVEALLLSALITWLVSRQLMREVQRKLGPTGNRVKELRFAAIFAALSLDILAIVIQRPKYNRLRLRRVISTLLKESIDPNASRMDLVTNVENRTHHYCSRKTGVYGS